MKTRLFLFVAAVVFEAQLLAAVCSANLIGGNWSNSATWDCGRVPSCGDDIVIPFGSVVTVSANINLSACGLPINIAISGELVFTSNKTISLPAGSCIGINPLGIFTPSLSIGSTNRVIIDGVTEWSGTLLTLPVIGPENIGCSITLPITLTSFDLFYDREAVQISWQTENELNNDFFTLESSTNGQYWQEIAQIDSRGSGKSPQKYTFVDKNPFIGLSYYRLSQTDKNGEKQVLNSISSQFTKTDYLVYPSPVSTSMYIVGENSSVNKRISFLNNQGDLVPVSLETEGEKLVINCSELANGNYFLAIDSEQTHVIKRIVVLHN